MTGREYDYPYYGQQPWYAILLQNKFLSCFTDESYYLSTAGRKHDSFSELHKEFSEIVNGMTIACAMSNSEKWKNLSADYFNFSPIYGMGFYHYMKTCPADSQYFATIWHTMGLNDEEAFIRGGQLGQYLQALKAKAVLPNQPKPDSKMF